jgi:hypothetical protein
MFLHRVLYLGHLCLLSFRRGWLQAVRCFHRYV